MQNDNFYASAGTIMCRFFGDRPDSFKKRIVDEFKKFVDGKGGTECFDDAQQAVDEYFKAKKGERHGRKRY